MTGRELILYILANNLEDEPVVDSDGKPIGFLTMDEVARRMNVGLATIFAWIQQGRMPKVRIGACVYIPADFEQKFK